jgi:hypothetical protein
MGDDIVKKHHRFGSTCAIIMGIAYVGAGLAFLVLPEGFTSGIPARFIQAYASAPAFLNAQYLAWTLLGLAAIGAVPAISELVRSANPGWVDFATRLALLAFAVLAVDNVRSMALDSILAKLYLGGDATARSIINTTIAPYQHLEPHDYITSGGAGLWVFVVSLTGLLSGRISKLIGSLGLVVASLYWVVVIGKVTQNMAMFSVVAIGAIVLAPIWYIAMGIRLRVAADTE